MDFADFGALGIGDAGSGFVVNGQGIGAHVCLMGYLGLLLRPLLWKAALWFTDVIILG